MENRGKSACDVINDANVREAEARAEIAELQLAREKQFLTGPREMPLTAGVDVTRDGMTTFIQNETDKEAECLRRVMTEALAEPNPEAKLTPVVRKRQTLSEIARELADTAAVELEQSAANGEIAFLFGNVRVLVRIGQLTSPYEQRI